MVLECLLSRASRFDAFTLAFEAAASAALVGVLPLRVRAQLGWDVFAPVAFCLIPVLLLCIGLRLTLCLIFRLPRLTGASLIVLEDFVLGCFAL